jgi:hypothetical protein
MAAEGEAKQPFLLERLGGTGMCRRHILNCLDNDDVTVESSNIIWNF